MIILLHMGYMCFILFMLITTTFFYISLLNQLYAIIIIFNIMNLQRNYSIKTKKYIPC